MAAYAGPRSVGLEPDADVAYQYLRYWFGDCTRGRIELGWMDADGRGLIHFARFELGDMAEAARASAIISAVPGQSCYVRACTVLTPDNGVTTDAQFCQSPGAWSDVDTPEQMATARAVQTMLRPQASVITGRTPHLRAQSYFKAEHPIGDAELVRSLNRGLARLLGSDPAVVNPTRLMRLPGTIAWPWKPGRVPELTSFAVDPTRPASYPVAMLQAQLPQEPDPAASSGAAPEAATLSGIGALGTARELMRRIRAGQDWHTNMVRLVAHWIGRGWSDAEIQAAAESFTLPGYTQAQTAAEVGKAIEGARRKWSRPDVEPLIGGEDTGALYDPWAVLVPPEFPLHALPARLAAWAESRSRSMGADVAALAWAGIAACGAAMDGKARLAMKRHDASYRVPPAIWLALVGPSAAKKSPILAAAWAPLERVQARALLAYDAAKRQYDQLGKEKGQAVEPPPPLRHTTHNATPEALLQILSRQDRGIACVHDELAGLIEGMDAPKQGKGAERAFYLQAHNGGGYIADRIARGVIRSENCLVTVVGGVQPAKLATMAGLSDDGFWQRFIQIIVGSAQLGLDEPGGLAEQDYALMVEGLAAQSGGQLVQLGEAAHGIREAVERDCFALERQAPLGERFASHIGKLPGLWGRLCLVLSQLDGLPGVVSERVAEQARTLIFKSALPNAARIAEATGGDVGAENMRSIAGYIVAKRKTRLLLGELPRDVRACRNKGVAEIRELLSPLVAGGWLVPEREVAPIAWTVREGVHEQFQRQAQIERERRALVRDRLMGEETGECD